MRHRKHRHALGVKKEHRTALIANLASALFQHGRITTTLAKAKALRPFAEKIITLAKKAHATDSTEKRLHWYRLAIARVRNKAVVKLLFDERVKEFVDRNGGYVRIYKLAPRQSDSAQMAIIELIDADDEGYTKPKRAKKAAKSKAPAEAPVESDDTAPVVDDTAPVADAVEAESEVAEAEPAKA